MLVRDKRPAQRTGQGPHRAYPPDLLPRLQTLLADLADIDFAYEKHLDALQRNSGDELIKREMLERLRLYHEKRRALVLAELTLLEGHVRALYGIKDRTASGKDGKKTVSLFRRGTRRWTIR
ncbi:hypothetical protein [Microvirga makkahensis]|uniref:Uncharacterized protein n=1 Tax=Microvirga makkahensis TaxID=1128670 RepID=A0A7X3MT99_9HYPH|nr:hypothetical protein [Microvirga makkahensis]MXQ12658.1 hypothetical protein [Microvirga makkahensis]